MQLNDETLLAAVPEYISVGGLLKATPSTDGGRRFIFFEASNEDVDHQNEIILQKALENSADYYLRHGNIDLSHFSIMGPKSGIPNFMEYEIGKPVAVRVDGKHTFVKAELYQGDSAMARNANMVWDSVTKQNPPSRWYPSVGGAVLSKSVKIDPVTKNKVAVIDQVRWNNTALDRCPVNKTVPEVSMAPVGAFAKSLGGFVMAKALEASYNTDISTLTGGGALGVQSLDVGVSNYFDFRDRLASAMRSKAIGSNPKIRDIVEYSAKTFGLAKGEAAEWVERFMLDLKTGIRKRSKP